MTRKGRPGINHRTNIADFAETVAFCLKTFDTILSVEVKAIKMIGTHVARHTKRPLCDQSPTSAICFAPYACELNVSIADIKPINTYQNKLKKVVPMATAAKSLFSSKWPTMSWSSMLRANIRTDDTTIGPHNESKA